MKLETSLKETIFGDFIEDLCVTVDDWLLTE